MTATAQEPAIDAERHRTNLVAAAAELVPLLREGADQSEQDRRLPDRTVDALRREGMFSLLTPRRWGGLATDVRTYLEVTEQLARGDSSAAWVSMILGGGSMLAGLFGDAAQEEVWDGAPGNTVCGVLTPSSTAQRTDDGYLLSGRWAFASGSLHCDWAVVAFPIPGPAGDPVDEGIALVPMSELAVEDTWYVAGMQGTGSNTLVAENVFVPDHRATSLVRAFEFDEHGGRAGGEHLWQTTLPSTLTLAIIGPMLGMAQAALERTLDVVRRGKPIAFTFYPRSAEAPSYQLFIADAASVIDTARLHAYRAADDIDRAAREGRRLDIPDRARVRMDCVVASTKSREAVDLLLNVGGASSFAQANPLQRIWRDLETATRHGTINPGIGREVYGRALLGIEETFSALI
ncbi:acyl-CoA dehydrogenase family protein [Rhodococcus sp. T2V]|uniref:acyl-CoA dehydrogenase family protein n=1 Tax=Rhodococcus sp. T2V TaxID=3034164 RepID=UPI0023E2A872|nr:acyl-CoA dehydrogenase family protein [Rhodococcus sp. T2V]MDF3312822.1 acyl-CoA dehydrogenase family protein [Rhodococcus sp. T2V]